MKGFQLVIAAVIAFAGAKILYDGEAIGATAVAIYLFIDAVAIACRAGEK